MAEKKRSLLDFGLDFLGDLLKSRSSGKAASPASLDDVPLDDLKKEKVRLDQRERTMVDELKDIESQKRKLFEEGVNNASEREQRIIARRIKELDGRAQNMDRMLKNVSKQMRILNGLIQLKERARFMSESGVASVLKDLDLQDLVIYIDQATVDGEFQEEKFDDLLRTLEKAEAVSPEYNEDPDVLDIMKEMQLAREAADSPDVLDERYSEMDRSLRQKESGAAGMEDLEKDR